MFILLLVLAGLVGLGATQCPNGWMIHDATCYLFSHGIETWADAVVTCQLFDSHLAEISNQKENDFVRNNIKGTPYSWIGANDIESEGEWKWASSHAAVTYLNWASTEPNNVSTGENCVFIMASGLWYDHGCHIQHNYVCQKPKETGNEIVG